VAQETKKWKAKMSIGVSGFPKVSFEGRNPFELVDSKHRDMLIKLGNFEDLGNNKMRYSGNAFFMGLDGTKYIIDANGLCNYDKENLTQEMAEGLETEMA